MPEQNYDKESIQRSPKVDYIPFSPSWFADSRYIAAIRKFVAAELTGILFHLMAWLIQRQKYTAPLTDLPNIAFHFRDDEGLMEQIVLESGLFECDSVAFWCPLLSEAMWPLDEKRRLLSEAGRRGGQGKYRTRAPLSHAEGSESQDQAAFKPPLSHAEGSESQDQASKSKSKSKSKREVRENIADESDPEFENFWRKYDKKVDRKRAERLWQTLNTEERQQCAAHVENYVKSKPNKKFRKDPATYLLNKSFLNEIISDEYNGINPEKGNRSSAGNPKNAGQRQLTDRIAAGAGVN